MLRLERARQPYAAEFETVAARLLAKPPRRGNGHAADGFARAAARGG
jgi:hypothetical protein